MQFTRFNSLKKEVNKIKKMKPMPNKPKPKSKPKKK
jgi:hypothetical protein